MERKFIISKVHEVVVDDIDVDLVTQTKWHVHVKRKVKYAHRTIYNSHHKKGETLHRVIMSRVIGRELTRTEHVDHINRNGLDNRRCNLRIASAQQNERNSIAKGGISRYKGVLFDRQKNKWKAQITVNRKSIKLGVFNIESDAAKQYDQAAYWFFGEFARPNFPDIPRSTTWSISDVSTHRGRAIKWAGPEWSEQYEKCVWCGTNDKTGRNRHFGGGACSRCYHRILSSKNRAQGKALGMTCRAYAQWKKEQRFFPPGSKIGNGT